MTAIRRREFQALIASLTALPLGALAQQDMRPWYFIFLETGKPTPPDKEAVQKMQKGHLDNFVRLWGAGKLFAAGPMRDPARLKRGIVVCRAETREALQDYFQPDEYVREGYMTVNAAVARPNKALVTLAVDPGVIEEARIILIGRDDKAGAEVQKQRRALLQQGLDGGRFGAWYTLETGPVAEVLFAKTTDSDALQAALANYPGVADKSVSLDIWAQYLGKGVLN
ncbi:hypothetical protein [Pelomonas sp. SE-A7]|uniref:YciI family protein n=1 Tax=Pelomonas sp. SE-A7 TaxID=3054953 RepID=UPI00259C8BC2|nr:hypothetical protein [Pelomonas sp. SE-A7]MDM4766920.1 hypothetical protein [Pelomonas sp. SE-A7]